nr:histidine kinase dimerization/phospho-acceptor domain-containing protein [Pacificimonas pallii]
MADDTHARVSARPRFHPVSGAFQGYAGRAVPDRPAALLDIPVDTVADVAHEVRTPLTAILGYAEMIEQQVIGPAPAHYRADARAMIAQTRRLLMAVDTLGDAAALDEGRAVHDGSTVGAHLLADRLRDHAAELADDRGAQLVIEVVEPAPAYPVDTEALFRAVARLLSAMLAFAGQDECVRLTLTGGEIIVSRPARLSGISEDALVNDRIEAPESADAPLLGLAFTLRVMQRLAHAHGGTFLFAAEHLHVQLPPTA